MKQSVLVYSQILRFMSSATAAATRVQERHYPVT